MFLDDIICEKGREAHQLYQSGKNQEAIAKVQEIVGECVKKINETANEKGMVSSEEFKRACNCWSLAVAKLQKEHIYILKQDGLKIVLIMMRPDLERVLNG